MKTMVMPLCGLSQVARDIYTNDSENAEAMRQHVEDLWMLNSDVLPNPDSFFVGTVIQVPDNQTSTKTGRG